MRTLLALLVLGLALASAAPASAQLELEPCLEDPVRCAGDTVNGVTDTLDETVDQVTETVDEVTAPVDDVVDPVDGGGPSPSAGDTAAPAGSEPGGDRTGPGATARPDRRPGAEPIATARSGTRRPARIVTSTEVPPPSSDSLDPIGRALSGSTETLAFPLTLILVLGGFLLVQARLDRSDPKLALAPVEDDDILSF